MAKEVIPYTTQEAWLAARAQDVTSTEIAALFNASPYRTAFELYHMKKSGIVEARSDNPRMRWGRRLQDPIAQGVAEDQGLVVRKMTEYIRDSEARLGSSFDFQIADRERGGGLMEIKTVDAFAFRDAWVVEDGEVLEAPAHIELQVQHQLLVSGMQWALIVALVGGNRISVIERSYDAKLGAAIMRKVAEFWSLVDQGTPPAPDYTRDAETIARLYVESTAGKTLDARDDTLLGSLVSQYQITSEEIRGRAKERDALRARILERIGDHSRVQLPDYVSLAAGTVRETIVPAYTRASYRALRVTLPKFTPTPKEPA